MKKIILFFLAFEVCLTICAQTKNVSDLEEYARIAIELSEYDQALSYLDSIPRKDYKTSTRKMRQTCIDTIGDRLYVKAQRYFSKCQFAAAIVRAIIKIPHGYRDSIKVEDFVRKNNAFLYKQTKGEILNKELAESVSKYKHIEAFRNGLARVSNHGETAYVKKNGEILHIDSWCYNPYTAFEGFCFISPLFCDSTGINIKTKPHILFFDHHDFKNGFAAIKSFDKKKWGFINKKGENIIPCKYDWVEDFHDGRALVCKGNKRHYIDTLGNIVIKDIIPLSNHFSEGIAWVYAKGKADHRFDAINYEGGIQISIDEKYDLHPSNFHCGLAAVEKESFKLGYRISYIRKNGTYIADFIYEGGHNFSENFAAVKRDEKWGFIDINGELAVPFIYNDVKDFTGGLAAVCIDNKWGYIDYDGNLVIPCIYDNADNFSENFAVVQRDGKMGFVDKYGFCTIDYVAEE